jgi:hypothetical protein
VTKLSLLEGSIVVCARIEPVSIPGSTKCTVTPQALRLFSTSAQ